MTSKSPHTSSDGGHAPTLRVSGLVRKFGEVVAVDEISLEVPPGQIRSVIGPNGAGKTTLFNLIMGRLAPTAGTVYLGEQELTDQPEEARPHHGIARAFQSNQLFVSEPVIENVRIVAQHAETGAFSLDLLRNGSQVARERAMQIVETVDLYDIRDKTAKNLSHGNQRRLGIAMALGTNPDMLLLDEPTSGMSPAETYETVELIEEIQEQYEVTILLIEHDMDVVLSISDQITVLDQGSIITTGTPEAVQDNEAVQNAYLGGVEEEL